MRISIACLITLLICRFGYSQVSQEVTWCKSVDDFSPSCNALRINFKNVHSLGDLSLADKGRLKALEIVKWRGGLDSSLNVLFPELTYLSLRKLQADSLPAWIYDLKKLEELDVSNSQLEFLSSSICSLPTLRIFHVWNTNLHELPDCLGEMNDLELVDLRSVQLSVPEHAKILELLGEKVKLSEPCDCSFD